jgi:hypothetical protein
MSDETAQTHLKKGLTPGQVISYVCLRPEEEL